jgi:hypothetical protein
MLHEVVPSARVIGFLQLTVEAADRELEAAADALGLKLIVLKTSDDTEFEGAFASLIKNGGEALLVSSNDFFNSAIIWSRSLPHTPFGRSIPTGNMPQREVS